MLSPEHRRNDVSFVLFDTSDSHLFQGAVWIGRDIEDKE